MGPTNMGSTLPLQPRSLLFPWSALPRRCRNGQREAYEGSTHQSGHTSRLAGWGCLRTQEHTCGSGRDMLGREGAARQEREAKPGLPEHPLRPGRFIRRQAGQDWGNSMRISLSLYTGFSNAPLRGMYPVGPLEGRGG